MAHALPASPGRRRRNRLIVAALVAAVVVVLAGAGLAIRNHRHHSSATSTTGTSSPTSASTSPTTTPAPTTASPSTPATSTPSTSTPSTSTPSTTSQPLTPSTTSPTTPVAIKVDLVIDNNTDRAGLAATARSRFEDAGWTVTKVGNISGGILSTCAFYDPSNPDNLAAAEALQAQFPAIRRVEPRFSRLPIAPIVVVLTSDYS